MLDVDNTTSFLLERGLIDTGWIIDGHLAIRSEARRNRNLRVAGPGTNGFLIKQPDDPGHGGHLSLRTEATFHGLCRQEPVDPGLARFMPRLIDADLETATLVFELIPDSVAFQSKIAEKTDGETAVASARDLGKSLATLHRCFRRESLHSDVRLEALPRALPWGLGLHRPVPDLLANLSAANYQTLRLLQTQPGLAEHLERLREDWRRETVIHGDVKFDNLLIQIEHVGDAGPSVRVWIVDWEMVQIGDPGWDLAGALQDFLVLWVRSIPMAEALGPDELIAQARVPLADLRGAIRALWDGYRTAADLPHTEADELLQRSVRFSAARLIQTAYEMLFTARHPSGAPVYLLQIAANLLAEPRRGQVQLYGIPWESALL